MLDPGGGGAPTRRRRKPTPSYSSVRSIEGGASVAAETAAAEAARTPGGPSPAAAAASASRSYERTQSEIGLSPAEKRAARAARKKQRQVVNEYVTQRETQRLRQQTLDDADSKNPKLKMSPSEIAREIRNSDGEIRRDSRALANSQRILRANRRGKVVSFRGVARLDYQNRKRAAKKNYRQERRDTRASLAAVDESLGAAATAVNKALTIGQLKSGGGPLDAVGEAVDTVTGGAVDFAKSRWEAETDADPTTGLQGTEALGSITKPAAALKEFVVERSEQSNEILNAAARGDDPGGEATLDIVKGMAREGRQLGGEALADLQQGRFTLPIPGFPQLPGPEGPTEFQRHFAETLALYGVPALKGGKIAANVAKAAGGLQTPSRLARATGLAGGVERATGAAVPAPLEGLVKPAAGILPTAGRMFTRKPLRNTLVKFPVLSAGVVGATQNPRETANGLSDAIGKLPEAEVGPALKTAAEVGTLTPQVLFHTAVNLATNKDGIRSTSLKAFPALAIETAQFPFVLAREMAAEGPADAISEMGNMMIDSATLRWGPAAGKIPYSAEVRQYTAQTGEIPSTGEPPEVTYISEDEWNAMENWEQFDALQNSPELGGALITLTEAAGLGAVISRGAHAAVRGTGKVFGKDLFGERPELKFTYGEGGERPQRASKGLFGRAGQDILDVTRKHVQKRRERRAGEPLPGGGYRSQPKVPFVGEGQVAPLIGVLRRRKVAKAAARSVEEIELDSAIIHKALLGRGSRRTVAQVLKGESRDVNRGLKEFASRTNEREWQLATLMAESGKRSVASVTEHLRERLDQVTERYDADVERATTAVAKAEANHARKPSDYTASAVERARDRLADVSPKPAEIQTITTLLNDINKGKVNPEAKVVQGAANSIAKTGRAQAALSTNLEAEVVGTGGLTAAEVGPRAKAVEHEVGAGRLPALEEQLGPTPARTAANAVIEAKGYRTQAKKLATRAAKLADKISHPERKAAQAKVAKEYREAVKRAANFERAIRQVQGRRVRQAVAKARRQSDGEKRVVDARVQRANDRILATQKQITAQEKIIAAERAKAKGKTPTTKAYKNAVKKRNDLTNLRMASQRKALARAKKLQTTAYAKAKKREKEAIHDAEAAARNDPRVKAADKALRHQKKRITIAERERRVVEDRARARTERYRKETARGVAEQEFAVKRRSAEAKRVFAREQERRPSKEPVLERSWGADRTEYTRSIGKKRLDEVLGVGQKKGKFADVEPGYLPDVKHRPTVRGGHERAGMSGEPAKRSTGYLYRTGRRDIDKDSILKALDKAHIRDAKTRKFYEVAERLGIPLKEALSGLGVKIPDRKLTRAEAEKYLTRIEETIGQFSEDITLVNAGRMTDAIRSELKRQTGIHGRLSPQRTTEIINEQINMRTGEVSGPLEALRKSVLDLEQHPDIWAELEGWRIVEKEAAEQIQPIPPTGAKKHTLAALQNSKALASKLLLGLNPQWLGFQIYSNMLLLGVANPRSFFGSGFTAWYDVAKLTPAARRAWEQTLGISEHMVDYGQFAGGKSMLAHTVMKAGWEHNRLWQKLEGRSLLNPMYRLDAKQNKRFKTMFLHDKVKREAWNRMDKRMRNVMTGYDRALGKHMPKGKARIEDYQAAFEEVVKDRKTMASLGREVDAWMGDYLAFTSAERTLLANNIMFYGFMRHSLTLALLTLPKHPIRAAILMKMGQAAVDDKREILRKMLRGALRGYITGQPGFNNDLPEDALQSEISHYMHAYVDPMLDFLPITTLGDFYFQGPVDTPFGTYGDEGWNRIGVGRAAALGNVFLEGGVLEPGKLWRLLSVVNPFITMAIEAGTGTDLFTGKPMKQGGDEVIFGFESLDPGEAAEHALGSFADLAPPVRGYIKGLSELPMSKKEMGFVPFGETPLEYETKPGQVGQAQAIARWARNTGTPVEELIRTTAPFAPQQVDPMGTLFSLLGPGLENEIGPAVRDWAEEWKAGGLGKPHSYSPAYEGLDPKLPQDRSLLPISDPDYRPPKPGDVIAPTPGEAASSGKLKADGERVPGRIRDTIRDGERAVQKVIALVRRGQETGPKADQRRNQQTNAANAKKTKAPAGHKSRAARDTVNRLASLSGDPDAKKEIKAALKYGPQYKIPPSLLVSQLEIETPSADHTGPPTAYGNAQGNAQFIPGTRDSVLAEHGVDAWGSVDEAVHAQAILLSESGFQDDPRGAIFAYNHSEEYVNDVVNGAAEYAELDEIASGQVSGGGKQKRPKVVSPVRAKDPDIIGTPYAGTHTLGNWQSDNALDIAVPTGTKIQAARKGVVNKVSGDNSDPSSQFNGFQVTIGNNTFYTHLSEVRVRPGDKVRAGQVIGLSGAANNVEHLHFGVAEGDDPEKLISGAPMRARGSASAPAGVAPPSRKALKKNVATEPPDEIASELQVPKNKAHIMLTKLDPALQNALVEVGERSGQPVQVTEGFRTRARQETLYAERASNPYPVAAPGTSNHEGGGAVDLNLTPEQETIAREVGLTQPVSGDPVHWELSAPTGYSAVGTTSGTSSGSFPSIPSSSVGATGATTATPSQATPARVTRPRKQKRGPSATKLLQAVQTRKTGGLEELLGLPLPEQGLTAETPLAAALGSAEALRKRTLKRTTA